MIPSENIGNTVFSWEKVFVYGLNRAGVISSAVVGIAGVAVWQMLLEAFGVCVRVIDWLYVVLLKNAGQIQMPLSIQGNGDYSDLSDAFARAYSAVDCVLDCQAVIDEAITCFCLIVAVWLVSHLFIWTTKKILSLVFWGKL